MRLTANHRRPIESSRPTVRRRRISDHDTILSAEGAPVCRSERKRMPEQSSMFGEISDTWCSGHPIPLVPSGIRQGPATNSRIVGVSIPPALRILDLRTMISVQE